jgi:hypothetical protein
MAKTGATGRRDDIKRLATRYGMSVNALYKLLQDDDKGSQKT